jgi:Cu(I)/Ag(I) efflux system membrane fusion protein
MTGFPKSVSAGWLPAAFVLGALLALSLGRSGDPAPAAVAEIPDFQPAAAASAAEPAHEYVCPMMCTPPMEAPGGCPICGMELKAMRVETDRSRARIVLSPESARLAEVAAAPARREFVVAEVRLFGEIDYDPAHTTVISAFMPGLVDRVYVRRAGQFVRWGDPLFDIYSSDLLETQRQLVEAMAVVPSFLAFQGNTPHVARDMPVVERLPEDQRTDAVKRALETIGAVRHKLSILGMPKRDIDELMKVGEATGIATVYASMYGQVSEQNAFEGAYVNTGAPIFTLADPRYVWLRLNAYESDYPWIRKSQEVRYEVDAYPGETFSGKVVYIDPVFNQKTRTFTLGVLSPDDQGGRMKPGMLARAVVHARLNDAGQVLAEGATAGRAPLVIPASAPLITGKRAVVYVADPGEPGAYEGREVTLGPRAGDHYVVLGGISEGERVVTRGSFKIDAAVQIRARPSLMSMPDETLAAEHHRPGGSDLMDEVYADERRRSRTTDLSDEAPDYARRRDHDGGRRAGRISGNRRRRPGGYGDRTQNRAARPLHESVPGTPTAPGRP